MDQEKIGRFIAECRKSKKLTQAKLAEYLGVTDRSVSNWENGKNMPDLSLFKPLCEILDITINELLSGEKLSEEDYQGKLEENIVNTISHTNEKNKHISKISLFFGFGIIFTAMIALISLTVITVTGRDAMNESSYRAGYDDGYDAGYQEGIIMLPAGNVEVKVSGSFTATVRDLIPDYMLDDETPRVAVVTFFQEGPVLLQMNDAVFGELEIGQTYTFIIDEQNVVLSSDELGREGIVDPDAVQTIAHSVTDVRFATEEEFGLECWRVYYSS